MGETKIQHVLNEATNLINNCKKLIKNTEDNIDMKKSELIKKVEELFNYESSRKPLDKNKMKLLNDITDYLKKTETEVKELSSTYNKLNRTWECLQSIKFNIEKNSLLIDKINNKENNIKECVEKILYLEKILNNITNSGKEIISSFENNKELFCSLCNCNRTKILKLQCGHHLGIACACKERLKEHNIWDKSFLCKLCGGTKVYACKLFI